MAADSGSTGILSASATRPKLAAAATSRKAVMTPPSVMSCRLWTVAAAHNACAAATTLMPGLVRYSAARAMTAALTPAEDSSPAHSRARMAVPSMARPVVTMMLSPSWAPPVVINRAGGVTSPSIAPAMMGREMPTVTSVWPPMMLTPSCRQAAARSANMRRASSGRLAVGSRMVGRNQRGCPPLQAMSLALTWTAYQPMRSAAKVMGSDLTSSRRPSRSSTAQSSPTWGPTSRRGSGSAAQESSSSESSSGGSLPAFNGGTLHSKDGLHNQFSTAAAA